MLRTCDLRRGVYERDGNKTLYRVKAIEREADGKYRLTYSQLDADGVPLKQLIGRWEADSAWSMHVAPFEITEDPDDEQLFELLLATPPKIPAP